VNVTGGIHKDEQAEEEKEKEHCLSPLSGSLPVGSRFLRLRFVF